MFENLQLMAFTAVQNYKEAISDTLGAQKGFIGDVGDNFGNTIDTITKNATTIGFALAALIIVVTAIIFFSGDERSAANSKRKWISVFVGIILLVGVRFFVNWAKGQAQQNFGS